MVGGKPINANKTYRFATHDYILKNGGDGQSMLRNSKILLDGVMSDNDLFIRYIKDHLNGVIGKEYSDPAGQGRITITSEASPTQSESTQSGSDAIYTVKADDCLWSIAASQLGNGARWEELYSLNKSSLSDPALIYIGQELQIPI